MAEYLRGTDIKLAAGVNELGGLHVIISECHEARRIDRQLAGRCARQGNAGSHEMFLSFEDEIVIKYAPLFLKWSKALNRKRIISIQRVAPFIFYWAQTRAERHQGSIRKGLLKMDENLQNLLAFSGKSE